MSIMIRFLLAALMCCLYMHALSMGFKIGACNCAGKRYSEVYAGSWLWDIYGVYGALVKEVDW